MSKIIEKVFLTGSRGFIGKRLVAELEKRGHEVCQYDLIDGQDIRDLYHLNKVIADNEPDVVIHMAARAGVGDSILYPDEYISTNIKGTLNVIEACKKNLVKKIIFFSSSSVLGGNETENGLSEKDTLKPKSLYGITKMTGEKLIESSGLQYAIVRPFTVYGENGRKDMVIYKWIKSLKNEGVLRIHGDGDSCRGYTYVGDLVNGVSDIIFLLRENKSNSFVINLGGEDQISIARLSGIFQKFCSDHNIELRVEYLPLAGWDVKKSFADVTLAKELINFKQTKKIDNIINSILKKELL